MKSGLIFGLMLLGSSCAPLPANQQSNGIQNANRSITTPTPEIVANDETDDSEKTTRVPPEFNGIDFKNFSYPTDWRKRRVKLKEGAYQHANPEGGGGDTFELDSIHFVDLHRDGRRLRSCNCLKCPAADPATEARSSFTFIRYAMVSRHFSGE